ncbi:unnamed protein product [Auanema sp. JU1783]|nr:unnamed protein product [Auanema sp. JU1783]
MSRKPLRILRLILIIVLLILAAINLHLFQVYISTLYNDDCEEILKAVLKDKYLSVKGNHGRIGNQLWTFAAGLSFAKALNRTFYISKNVDIHDKIMKERIITERIFPRLKDLYVHIRPPKSMEKVVPHSHFYGKDDCCRYQDPLDHASETSPFLMLDTSFTQHIKNIYENIDEFKKYLEFNSQIKIKGRRYMDANALRSSDGILCAHIRMTDFVRINRTVPREVLLALTEYVLVKEKKKKILLFGDDRSFLHEMLHALTKKGKIETGIVSDNESGVDLFLASEVCSSYLITHQSTTFGFWSAFLTKNWKSVYFYYVPYQEPTLYRSDFLLPWNAIGYSGNQVAPITLVN